MHDHNLILKLTKISLFYQKNGKICNCLTWETGHITLLMVSPILFYDILDIIDPSILLDSYLNVFVFHIL